MYNLFVQAIQSGRKARLWWTFLPCLFCSEW